jgi:hypothetical protein
MNDIKSYARFAKDLLQTVADGIGKLETNAASLPGRLPSSLTRRLPSSWVPQSRTSVMTKVLVAGVAVSTAAMIYSFMRSESFRTRARSAWSGLNER